jgi:hypothetical protein
MNSRGEKKTIPVVALSQTWVCGRSLTGIASSIPPVWQGRMSLVNVVCRQVEVFTSGSSFGQSFPTDCRVRVCDLVQK